VLPSLPMPDVLPAAELANGPSAAGRTVPVQCLHSARFRRSKVLASKV
jgi:hypothetical protein